MNTSSVQFQPQSPCSSGGTRILVVEDEFLIRYMLFENLREVGYEVGQAANADEALKMFSTFLPELIITDVRMPGSMDGLGLHATIRVGHPTLPIIIVSGHLCHLENLDEFTQFLPKPYHAESLIENIRAALDGTTAQK